MKTVWQSNTIRFGAAFLALAAVEAYISGADWKAIVTAVVAAVGMLLRYFLSKNLVWKEVVKCNPEETQKLSFPPSNQKQT